jgi:hypothetical protein
LQQKTQNMKTFSLLVLLVAGSASGPDGAWFRIDSTTDCLNWAPVCTNQVVDGAIDFADPDAADSAARWYRAVPLANAPGN